MWTQEQDGHYTFSGPIKDSGAITAVDGKIQQFSNASEPPLEIFAYEFNNEVLVTTGSVGPIEWHRVSSSRRSNTSNRASTHRDNTNPADDIIKRRGFQIPKPPRFHFP
jgi:hypothetical protein